MIPTSLAQKKPDQSLCEKWLAKIYLSNRSDVFCHMFLMRKMDDKKTATTLGQVLVALLSFVCPALTAFIFQIPSFNNISTSDNAFLVFSLVHSISVISTYDVWPNMESDCVKCCQAEKFVRKAKFPEFKENLMKHLFHSLLLRASLNNETPCMNPPYIEHHPTKVGFEEKYRFGPN